MCFDFLFSWKITSFDLLGMQKKPRTMSYETNETMRNKGNTPYSQMADTREKTGA